MATIKDYLQNSDANQFHIFDSHQEKISALGKVHKDQDYIRYSYNIHKNNKPKAGDVFLYRRPGKSTVNRKFNIYGGGVISYITEPDEEGNVFAEIVTPFKLVTPIEQGSDYLENFQWKSKNKKPNSWEHFWNQYGMNLINKEDFFNLVGALEYVIPANYNAGASSVKESTEELVEIETVDPNNFEINVDDDDYGVSPTSSTKTKTVTARFVDYDKVQKTKKTTGDAGELLVLEMLYEQYEGTSAIIEHVAKSKGDGLGYDIKLTLPDGSIHLIEVKTTKANYIDGYYITPNELSVSKKCSTGEYPNTFYDIYRVYGYDSKNKKANIKIINNFKGDDFRLEPTVYKVHVK